ncbi:MAG TPA: BolA/IbaG family iron-sulfur metabolism protein [Gammaproteobacteria bacterium]|jgi:acid stress-induced BolA-like protein IbaG/YrbA|nr:BolA/IbaG family iron-sulfur metabolism protein [Xanthomonadales bacterium]MCB1595139.1 BolA/IbaG family iron-sulfur metabolism protein [Xanthomonadales bacterium]HOP22039.1 BolA/IbaG family iron-sulfur metabolism protein [Gammaproteobacteria bacterium]HPI95339.1 BolA/IbaG family iron-sulfur metabolism protein [Gammaproteobacteria bacterium]HPQ86573.1 BolA/IbaG family iron-sulfur metabolism protein [Gammaproteobacteria bacterium]
MEPSQIEELIAAHINCDYVKVESNDNRHYQAVIVSKEFEGKIKISRHRLVYSALGDSMQNAIHAFSFQAYTPEEYNKIA